MTSQPSWNSAARRSHICCRVRPGALPEALGGAAHDSTAALPGIGHQASGGGGMPDHAVHEDAGGMDLVGIDRADRQNVLFDLDQGGARRHRHHGIEVALRAAELQIAEAVGNGARGLKA